MYNDREVNTAAMYAKKINELLAKNNEAGIVNDEAERRRVVSSVLNPTQDVEITPMERRIISLWKMPRFFLGLGILYLFATWFGTNKNEPFIAAAGLILLVTTILPTKKEKSEYRAGNYRGTPTTIFFLYFIKLAYVKLKELVNRGK